MVSSTKFVAPLPVFTPADGALEIVDVSGDDSQSRRLCELGLCKGKTLAVVKAGDPAIINIGGSRFALAGALQVRIMARPQSTTRTRCNDMPQPVSMAQVPIGGRARILELRGDNVVQQRMLELGLLPGVEVRMVRAAPLGDPLEIELLGYSLSVRKSEAAQVQVEVLP